MSADKALIVGLGLTGMSLIRHALSRGLQPVAVDTRDSPPQLAALRRRHPQVEFQAAGSFELIGAMAAGFERVWVSSGVSPAWLGLPAGCRPCGDLQLFTEGWLQQRQRGGSCRLILITGTNGKSTCATLTAGRLAASGRRAVAIGNIGVPLLDCLEDWKQHGWPEIVVAEVSSYQLALRPDAAADIACLLNISPHHLAWHGSARSYAAAKRRVYEKAAVAVFNRGDANSVRGAAGAQRQVGFGGGDPREGEWTIQRGMLMRGGASLADSLPASSLLRIGIMPENAAAAFTIAETAGCPLADDASLGWLSEQHGLAHRLHHLGSARGISYIDDSKATNEAAACAAIAAVGAEGTVLIAGGDCRPDCAFSRLAKSACKLAGAVLLGDSAPALAQAFDDLPISLSRAADMKQAVSQASCMARQLGARRVLLSPACPSFDMFADFGDRGDAFALAVRSIGATDKPHAA